MANKYPNSGALFPAKKASPKAPDHTGKLSVNADLLKSCPRDSDGNVEIRIAAWEKSGQNGSIFLSIVASAPQPRKEPWE